MVMSMREHIDAKMSDIRKYLDDLERDRYEAISERRHLRAWVDELITALNDHDIVVPSGPGSQYSGDPSPHRYRL